MGCYWKCLWQNTVPLFIALIASFLLLAAARPLEGESGSRKAGLLLGSLPRGATPGPSRCTNVPGNGRGRCPESEMHFVVHAQVADMPDHFHDTVPRFGTSADNETLPQRA